MKAHSYKNPWLVVPSLLTLLLFGQPCSSFGQSAPSPSTDAGSSQEGSQQSDSPEKKDDQGSGPATTTDDVNPELPRPPATLTSPLFRLMGGGLLEQTESPLRLGPIYLSSAEILGAYNAFSPSDNAANNGGFVRTGALMRASIVVDELFKNVRFTAQWEPRLSIFDGTVYSDLDNGVAGLDANFKLNDRLNLALSDRFSYFATNLFWGYYFLTSTVVTTSWIQQNSYLNAPGHSLNNNAYATLSYQISPLTKLYVAPSFNYFHTNTETSLLNSSTEETVTFGLQHTFSENTSIGLSYSLGVVQFENTNGPSMYQYFTGNYSHLFSPTFSFTGSAGASTYRVSNDSRSWTFTGSATLMKTFRNNSVSIGYVRALDLSDYITSDFTDRLDAQYTRRLSERLTFMLGAGLQRESRVNGYHGNYAQTGLSFRLSRMLSTYARYSYSQQTGDLTGLIPGTTNLVVFGLSFQAPTTGSPQH
jgi:hypothetical protein